MPVHVQERRQKLRRARQRLEAAEGRAPSTEELAEAAQLKLEHAEEALHAVEASVSLNQAIGDGDGEFGDLFADTDADDPVELADTSFEHERLRQALSSLEERERRVLELRFGLGEGGGEQRSLEQIGRELGLARADPSARGERHEAPRAAARPPAGAGLTNDGRGGAIPPVVR